MNTAHAESTSGLEDESLAEIEYRTRSCGWGWQSFGALIGLLGGLTAAFLGSIFTVMSWFMGAESSGVYMQTMGTDFLLLTIPLLILGAHCLDVVEKGKKKKRKAEFDENN